MAPKLPNYLRTFRRRAGLAQDDVAFLLGSPSGTRVGRHERSRRLPIATTIFAYEVVFQAPARELFAGLYDRVERETVRRALELADQLKDQAEHARKRQKLETLQAIYVPFAETTPADALGR